MQENTKVSETRDKIKSFLAAQGMIKGHPGSVARPSEEVFLRLMPDETGTPSSSESTLPQTPRLSPNEVPRMLFHESDFGSFSPTYYTEYDDDSASFRFAPHLPIPGHSVKDNEDGPLGMKPRSGAFDLRYASAAITLIIR